MDKANRAAATVRKTSRIVGRLPSSGANVNDFLPGRDIGEPQQLLARHATDVDGNRGNGGEVFVDRPKIVI